MTLPKTPPGWVAEELTSRTSHPVLRLSKGRHWVEVHGERSINQDVLLTRAIEAAIQLEGDLHGHDHDEVVRPGAESPLQ